MKKQKSILILSFILILFFLSACSFEDLGKDSDDKNTEKETTITTQEEPVDTEDSIVAPEVELQKKDQGDQVELLQKSLNEIGYTIDVNGIYDEMTTWAITDFQLQHENLMALGVYNTETKEALESFIENNHVIEAGLGLLLPDQEVTTNTGIPVISNPYDQLALINKEQALPENYIPEDLVVPNVRFPYEDDVPKKQMRQVAATALEELFAAADDAGLELYAQSGYRSYETQKSLFANYVSNHGEEEANIFSARPGESEHQSGLTMDVTSPDVSFDLNTDFGDTDEGIWLQEHVADFGFIIRFPEGKEDITQYQYEPWHLRYVGNKTAQEIMSEGITLEEYYN
ncbi:D-alanyl-D-alanine carboxypeptidase family protein [Oceanobacillus bengalensis]|uniref:D-alanyl-D-alanine carboxypeptidase family protein n=1 Tax=Oceanobacillus bengalensis TaxID=1435466 RepID=A0A494Z2X7_9BACI|nr:D-alanyl-D-alanine carboxypeptidase family protein [Oceanobacillus bengalensis]RKQ16859.1 D-alanyl-D-alanine carboxypeptidase family protein [Oceanobacillus bengalensis]